MFDHFDCLYIDGRWVKSHGASDISIENPATLETFARVPASDTTDVDLAVRAARNAQQTWSETPLARRIELMQRMLELFKERRETIIEWEAKELGAPVSFGKQAHCDYQFDRIASYIELASRVELESAFAASTVYREPIGVVACLTPWNYPLGQIVQKMIPAVLMGNTVVVKPSQLTPLTAYLLFDAFDRAGFPAGVVNLVTGKGADLGRYISTHPDVDMVSFTGSTRVGIELSQLALGSVKRISLELGGKSPYIWLPSESYEAALPKLLGSIFLNSGQTCTSLSRLLVPRKDLERIERSLVEAVSRLRVGDPLDPATDIGPVASRAQYDKISDYIRIGLAEGARLLVGGLPDNPDNGYWIAPTVFSDVSNKMRIAQEEIFGPVLCVIPYDTIDEAIDMANDTIYGLNAAVYGPKDMAVAVAKRIKSGNVYINDAPRDLTAPFGGYKQSGLGREGGLYGLLEFTELKTVYDHGN